MRYIVFLLTLLISVNAYALVNWNNAGIWNEFQTNDTVDITLDEDEVGLSITANATQTNDLIRLFDSDGSDKLFFVDPDGFLEIYNPDWGTPNTSNYERVFMGWDSNEFVISTQRIGGSARNLSIGRLVGGFGSKTQYSTNLISFYTGTTKVWEVSGADLFASNNGDIGDNSGKNPTNIFYDGKSVPTPQAVSCTCSDDPTCGADATAATLTLEPTSNSVRITNADPNGCDVTMSETNAIDGHMVRISVVSNAGGSVDFADTAGVLETTGALSLDEYDVLGIEYVSDRWVEAFQSNN